MFSSRSTDELLTMAAGIHQRGRAATEYGVKTSKAISSQNDINLREKIWPTVFSNKCRSATVIVRVSGSVALPCCRADTSKILNPQSKYILLTNQ